MEVREPTRGVKMQLLRFSAPAAFRSTALRRVLDFAVGWTHSRRTNPAEAGYYKRLHTVSLRCAQHTRNGGGIMLLHLCLIAALVLGIPVTPITESVVPAEMATFLPVNPTGKQRRPAGAADAKQDPTRGKKTPDEKAATDNIRHASQLIDEVLMTADKVEPPRYRILAETEAATMLSRFDRQRSLSVLKKVIAEIRTLLADRQETTIVDDFRRSKERALWFSAIRKIAALEPDLARDLLLQGLTPERQGEPVFEEWTEEARALISAASNRIETDPGLAARLAEQTLPLGLADWPSFLIRLAKRDSEEAERLAIRVMTTLSGSSASPLYLRNFALYTLAPGRSPNLRQQFFRSMQVRIRRVLRPDVTRLELEDAISAARNVSYLAQRYSPDWQAAFDEMGLALARVFKERDYALAPGPRTINVDVSTVGPATPSGTWEVSDALRETEKISNPAARDNEYSKLAIEAARRGDTILAEQIMARISGETLQSDTSVAVYQPLAQKAIEDSSWPEAQGLASRIKDPLGRALAFDRIGAAMSAGRAEKRIRIENYGTALASLYRENPTERVAKASLFIARRLYELDSEQGVGAMRHCVSVLNRLAYRDPALEESEIGKLVGMYVPRTEPALNPEELLNLADLLSSAFRQVAVRDAEAALSIALGLAHRGMYSFAQLAVAGALLEEAKRTRNRASSLHRAGSARVSPA